MCALAFLNFSPLHPYTCDEKSRARSLADNSNDAREAINLHSLTGQQTFERMLTQMELMHNVVDLDRPISIRGEQIAETLITRPAVPPSLLPLRLPAIVLSRDSHRQHLPKQHTNRDVAPLSCARCIYEIVITSDPTRAARGARRRNYNGTSLARNNCSARYRTLGCAHLDEMNISTMQHRSSVCLSRDIFLYSYFERV